MLKLRAYAKINLSLDVVGKLDNGYHELCMVMHTVKLYDIITITEKKNGGIRMTTNLPYLPANRNNLVMRAAELFFEHSRIVAPNLHIHLKKYIPVGAGLAGGSSDAAAVLRGLNEQYGRKLSRAELMEIGKTLGADVPYCIMGGTALAEGIGEKLTPLPRMPKCYIVLAKPKFSLSTPAVFGETDLPNMKLHPDTRGMLEAIRQHDLKGIAVRMFNVLEDPAKKVIRKQNANWCSPHIIDEYKRTMLKYNSIGTVMSGSGPTVFGLFIKEEDAQEAYRRFRQMTPDTFLTTT